MIEEVVDLAEGRKQSLRILEYINLCDFRSLRRIGTCEDSARVFYRPPASYLVDV